MALPFFYINHYSAGQKLITLDEDTSRHIVQVLRMKAGEELHLTDGKGNLLTCGIEDANKRHCRVAIKAIRQMEQGTAKVSVAISLLKNANRFEWFLEKATEIGVREIIPLVCDRTEKEKFRYDRMQGICISAMLQSRQCWLPVLNEPMAFREVAGLAADRKFIAYCEDGNKQELGAGSVDPSAHQLILIGPEGDFTPAEINLALQHEFIPVSLGKTRLRSETAGVAAAVLLLL